MSRVALTVLVVGLCATACKESETTPAPPPSAIAPKAIASAPASTAPAPTAPVAGVAWSLELDPGLTFTMADRAKVKIWIVATNKGSSTLPTMREALELRNNGKPSPDFAFAFGNGLRTMDWDGLAPGKTVREARELGMTLFPAAGDYDLELLLAGATVARVQVKVLP